MGKMIPMRQESIWRKNYRCSVYEHRLVTADGLSYTRSFIVVKNRYDVIVRFTRLHNFSGAYNNKVFLPLASDVRERLYYICRMLNYVLVDHYGIYQVNHVFKVTKNMLVSFLIDYALEKSGMERIGEASALKNVSIPSPCFSASVRLR